MTNGLTKVSRGTLTSKNLISSENKKVEMTLNTNSAVASGLLIQRLTELYNNPIEASVRETISNAFDALAVVDYKGVVTVLSPTELSPILIISDNGTGMSYDDLVNVYSKYGASTKQDNFDQVGAYGLGAKAPLAYGTEFTVTSVKNGEKTSIIVAREELTNYIKVLARTKTDEPNGTTVSIPVKSRDVSEFQSQLNRYKRNAVDYKSTLIIDGEEVTGEEMTLVGEMDLKVGSKKARVWVRKNKMLSILHLFLNSKVHKSELENEMISFIIGGYDYNCGQNYYNSNFREIQIELIPGLVSFNSSRDSILSNERFDDLKTLVFDYLSSENFKRELINSIKDYNFDDFLTIVSLLIEGEVTLSNGSLKSYYSNSSLLKNLLDLTHNETGYSISKAYDEFLKIPQKKYSNFAITTTKHNGKIILTKDSISDDTLIKNFNHRDVKISITELKSSYNAEKEELSTISLFSAAHPAKNKRNTLIVTDCTEIEKDGATFLKEHSKVLKHREFILNRLSIEYKEVDKMRDGFSKHYYRSSYSESNVEVVMTLNTKSEIEKAISNAKLTSASNVKIVSYSELEKIFPKVERKKGTVKKRTKVDLNKFSFRVPSENLYSFDLVKFDEIEKSKKNKLFLISDNQRNEVHERTKVSYCLENNLSVDDVDFYIIHPAELKSAEIAEISKYGVIIDCDFIRLGYSNMRKSKNYDELVKRNVSPKITTQENFEKNREIINVFSYLSHKSIGNLGSILSKLEELQIFYNLIEKEPEISKVNIDISKIIRKMNFIVNKLLGNGLKFNYETIDKSVFEEYYDYNLLTPENKKFMAILSNGFTNNYSRCLKDTGTSLEWTYSNNDLIITSLGRLSQVVDKNTNSFYYKLFISQVATELKELKEATEFLTKQ